MAQNKGKSTGHEVAREDDANDLNDTAPYGHAKGQTSQADFDRNRDGLYGGLPDARKHGASGGEVNESHPAKATDHEE